MEPIHELLRQRFSPRSFEKRSIPKETIRTLLEAARWAPSSFNEQPWRFVVATPEDPREFERLLACLVPENQVWAKDASVLILSIAKLHFSHNNTPNNHAFHDVGLGVTQLIVQASHFGLSVHQMAGFNSNTARSTYSIPEEFTPVTVIAVGYSNETQPNSRSRLSQNQIVFGKSWDKPF